MNDLLLSLLILLIVFRLKDSQKYPKVQVEKMLIKPSQRLGSQIKGQSTISNSHSRMIHCVIQSDSPDRGSLYISGMKGVENIDNMRMLNVKSVLTCSQGCKLNYNSDDIPNYRYLPFPQESIFSLNEYFRTVSSFINESLQKQNCVVHCENGGNKSISAVIAYLIRYQSKKFQQALSYVKNKMKIIDLNQKYQQALRQFEKHINQNQQKFSDFKSQNISYLSSKKSQISKKMDQSMDSKQLDLNPQDTDVKSNKFDTSRRYKTSKTYLNDESINQGHQQQKIKVKTQYPSNIKSQVKQHNEKYLTHKQALYFDQIYSSSHIEYVGVKRQPKNSKSCFKKQKSHAVSFSPQSHSFQIYEPEAKIDYLTVEKDLNKSRFSSRKNTQTNQKLMTQRSQRRSQNHSVQLSRNGRERTKRTQQMQVNKSFLKVFNPQNQQLSKSRVSHVSNKSSNYQTRNKSLQRSQQSKVINEGLDISQIVGKVIKISPSKREHFERVNQQLNHCIDQITTEYETGMTNLRVNYHNRLRHLRPTKKQVQASQSSNIKA